MERGGRLEVHACRRREAEDPSNATHFRSILRPDLCFGLHAVFSFLNVFLGVGRRVEDVEPRLLVIVREELVDDEAFFRPCVVDGDLRLVIVPLSKFFVLSRFFR